MAIPIEKVQHLFEEGEKGDSCWPWVGRLDRHGYGQFTLGRKTMLAHRVVYQAIIGPIPVGMTLDHLCRVRRCVNPSHLEPVTKQENTLRGDGPTAQNARKTHCPAGHPYEGPNLYINQGRRHCRLCIRRRTVEHLRRRAGRE